MYKVECEKKKLHFYKDIGKMNKVIFKIKDSNDGSVGLKIIKKDI